MQKVVGSSPIIRLEKAPENAAFSLLGDAGKSLAETLVNGSGQHEKEPCPACRPGKYPMR
jgi:hypothetical protein